MTKDRKPPSSHEGQSGKFIEAVRELGCDENESAFDEMVKKVAKASPPQKEGKGKKPKRSV